MPLRISSLALPFPGCLQHPLKVIIRCSGKGVPNSVDFLDDRVLTRHDQSSFTNSTGVQMTVALAM